MSALTWLKKNNLVQWRVIDSKGRKVGEFKPNPQQDKKDGVDSFESLESCLDVLQDGSYTVYGRKLGASGAGEMAYEFTIGGKQGKTTSNFSLEREYLEEIRKKDLIIQKKDFRIMLLQRDIKDLRQEVKELDNNGGSDVIDKIAGIMGLFTKQQPQPQQIGNITETEDSIRIENALKEFAGMVGTDKVALSLEKLVDFAKNNPVMAKQFLGI